MPWRYRGGEKIKMEIQQQIPKFKATREDALLAWRFRGVLFTLFFNPLPESLELCTIKVYWKKHTEVEVVFCWERRRREHFVCFRGFLQIMVKKWAKVWMKRITESYLLSLGCYKASRKTVNQLWKRMLVGHKLNDACRYFVGKLFCFFIIFLSVITSWYTTSKKYTTPILAQLICTQKGITGKTYPKFAHPGFILCSAFAQFLPPK